MNPAKLREGLGAVASVAWLVASLYLYLSTPNAPVFTWSGAAFLLIGLFLAIVGIGFPTYWLQRHVTGVLMPSDRVPSRHAAMLEGIVSLTLLLAETILIFFVTRWAFDQIVL